MQAMTLRLPDDVHEALRREKYETRRSMQEIVVEAIEYYFANREESE